jgi:predicted transcriptional regulator
MEQALEEIETRNVQEIVQAGLRSVKEKRVSSHTDVVNRIHARRGKSK